MKPEDRPFAEQMQAEANGGGLKSYRDFVGIKCRNCGSVGRWRVYYTRAKPGAVFRVRKCIDCEGEIKTLEREVLHEHGDEPEYQ